MWKRIERQVIVRLSEQSKQGFILRVKSAFQGPRCAISIQSAISQVRIVICLIPVPYITCREKSTANLLRHVAHEVCGWRRLNPQPPSLIDLHCES